MVDVGLARDKLPIFRGSSLLGEKKYLPNVGVACQRQPDPARKCFVTPSELSYQ